MSKPTFAMYWAASCGGCEISVLNIGDRLLAVDEAFDVVFWPVAADFKYDDVRGYPDGYIDVCLFNGSIRNSENEEIAHLLRRKSKVLVAFGSCAMAGGIPALSNLTTNEETLRAAYLDNVSTYNPDRVVPQPNTTVPEGELHIPVLYETVRSLDQVVDVDYYMPGCPPEPHQIWAVLETFIQGKPLPKRGSVIGAGEVAVCHECPLQKDEKTIERFYRPYEVTPEPGRCLLEQGIVCLGAATRSGCGALCPQVNMGCRGCYGPVDDIGDQGAKILAAIASVMDGVKPGKTDHEIEQDVEAGIETIADPAGTFYRFGLAHSVLRRARKNGRTNGTATRLEIHHEENQY